MDPLNPSRSSSHRNKRKLLLFCQHPVAEERFLRLLNKAGFEVVVSSELRWPAATALVADTATASLVVLDCSDVEAALDFLRGLRAEQPRLPVLALLPKLQSSHTYPLLRLGVKGVLAYSQAPRQLARVAGKLAGGGYCIPHELLTGFIESILPELYGSEPLPPEIEISRREREVLDLLLENLANKEIAAKLFVSERTVKFHVSNLLSKFGVQRRADLIVLWMRRAAEAPWQARERALTLSTHIN
jgi:two-component system, NarL family, response regulator LiaR